MDLHRGGLILEAGVMTIISSQRKMECKVNNCCINDALCSYPHSGRHARKRSEKPLRRMGKGKAARSHAKVKPAVVKANFDGPKNLAQIIEEKSRVVHMYLRKPLCRDFEGPKPLLELLKNNRRPLPGGGKHNGIQIISTDWDLSKISALHISRNVSSCIDENSVRIGGGTDEKEYEKYEDDLMCEDEDDGDYSEENGDDDNLEKKLAHILGQ